MALSPYSEGDDYSLVTAGADRVRRFGLPEGVLIQSLESPRVEQAETIVNCLAVNQDGVLFAGGDDGSLAWYDWQSGRAFQRQATIPQPGSLEMETGIFAACFDRTGMRLFTAEMDKTIKVWAEQTAVE